ncbi:MAG: hypothetical protein QG597_2084 [Actinomycetota bacterium]|nr:hypothetical protein [Actinomycetota bacterium]
MVRDEEWLVTGVEHTRDGALLTVQVLSELVRETTGTFYERYDTIRVHDPARASVEPDPSPGTSACLWATVLSGRWNLINLHSQRKFWLGGRRW